MPLLLLFVFFFVFGAATVVGLEALALWLLIQRLNRKIEREEIKTKAAAESGGASPPSGDSTASLFEKQGDLWVLTPDKISTAKPEDKAAAKQRRSKDIVEVIPVKKHARIKDHSLFLGESDGTFTEIVLSGCTIFAVSASSMSSRKWAKRYPIKVENKDSAIYKGYRSIYLYIQTSWEKESWCKALRLASSNNQEKVLWFTKLNMEFYRYLASLNAGYPSIIKPSAGSGADLINKSSKVDNNSSSRVRQFMKKLAKKASKSEHEYKISSNSVPGDKERKFSERSVSFPDSSQASGSVNVVPIEKPPSASSDDSSAASAVSASSESGSRIHSGTSNLDSEQKTLDEGSLCLNLLISRLFFDAKINVDVRSSIQSRIQRTLSNMRIPYIGEVTCTALDLGSLPPRILAMRVLPSDMSEIWALEIDLEYLNGISVDVETRLEVRDSESEGELDTKEVGEVTNDLLEGFKYLGEQLNLSEETTNQIKPKDERDRGSDENENYKGTASGPSQVSRWRSALNSFTKQMSEVPLSLLIKVSSLRGTVLLCLKPPPSDQIWFGFVSMPDIEFNLEAYVGDRKITSGRLSLFLISRFKAAIRDTLVLPNFENVGISWMLAEKDDWVPRKVAPFLWSKSSQDSGSSTTKREATSVHTGEAMNSVDVGSRSPARSEVNNGKPENVVAVPQFTYESLGRSVSSSSSVDESRSNDGSLLDLRAPLLKENMLSRSLVLNEGQSNSTDDVPRRMGTRERMLGLGKKMGEKLEVKRRHIEEKGRNLVEKMRGPAP